MDNVAVATHFAAGSLLLRVSFHGLAHDGNNFGMGYVSSARHSDEERNEENEKKEKWNATCYTNNHRVTLPKARLGNRGFVSSEGGLVIIVDSVSLPVEVLSNQTAGVAITP